MKLRTQLIKDFMSSKVINTKSYQQNLDTLCYKICHRAALDYRDLQIINTYLSIYADILFDVNESELSRVGTILADKVPNIRHLNGKEKNDYLFQQYSYFMEMACQLDEWIDIDRKILAKIILEIMISQHEIPIYRILELAGLINLKLVLLTDIQLILNEMSINDSYVYEIIEILGVEQVDKSNIIIDIICKLIKEHDKEVQQYLDGNQKILGFFTGKIMKTSTEKLNPAEVNTILKQQLEKLKA